jgi:heat shock protein HslJ
MRKNRPLDRVTVLMLTALGAAALFSGGTAGAQPDAPRLKAPRSLAPTLTRRSPAQVPGSRITAEFNEGRVSGTGGCNAYSAAYEAKNGELTISAAISTMMMCSPQAIMDQESAYLKALQAAAAFKIDADQLTISDANGATLVGTRPKSRES